MIEKLPYLRAAFDLSNSEQIVLKSHLGDGKYEIPTYNHELIDKINELVDAVNVMRGEH